jgi:hypothetical protein
MVKVPPGMNEDNESAAVLRPLSQIGPGYERILDSITEDCERQSFLDALRTSCPKQFRFMEAVLA